MQVAKGFRGYLPPARAQDIHVIIFGRMKPMWTDEELARIGKAEELQISPLRRDQTLRNPVTIWVVRVEDDLYVRGARGRKSPWFRAALQLHKGHIRCGGVEKDVVFQEVGDADLNERINSAYLTKYHHYPQYVAPMVTSEVQAATIKLISGKMTP